MAELSQATQELILLAEQTNSCSLCRLCEGRTNSVPGSGNYQSDIVFIGEGPGKNEDVKGIPFCGASGKLLDKLLASIGLERSDIFITNIVKCRPPDNRDPKPDEKEVCASNYLNKQLALIKPKLIVTLGRHALNHFLPDLKISEVHGQPTHHKDQVFLALYHPAVALYNPNMREALQQDFSEIPKLIKKLSIK